MASSMVPNHPLFLALAYFGIILLLGIYNLSFLIELEM